MKLVALKRFSSRVPTGATFDIPDRDARVLIAAKVAKPYDEEPERKRRTYRRRDLTADTE